MFSEEPLHVSVKNAFIVNMQITAYTALAFEHDRLRNVSISVSWCK